MNENKQDLSSLLERVDLYSILRDTLRSLWAILLGAIAVAMIVNMSVRADFRSTYTTTATFVVTSRTSSNYAYSNLSAASTMASSFSNILNSNLLKKKVCQDLGMSSFRATTAAKVISGTNLMTLRVTADTPENTYRITRSIMDNVSDLTQFVSGDMVMEVLQDPTVPTKADASFSASGQTRKAFILSFLAIALVFMFLSYRKETIKSEKDLESKLDAKSLGMLHSEERYHTVSDWLKRRPKKHLVTELSAKFEFVERYKKIAAHVSSQGHRLGAKTILVTSVQEHEGKSTVSANLALTLVQQGYKVLLIDGDLRRPTQQTLFLDKDTKLKASLGSLLMGQATLGEAMIYDEDRDLDLLLNKRNYTNSTDIVSSEYMSRLLAVVRDHFDFVIIDSPPMSLMADAEVLADLSDMSILVVKYDTVLAEDLNDAIDALRDCHGKFSGCILNQVKTLPGARRTIGGYGGYGRYGRYGRYGNYGRYGAYGRYGKAEQ
ncbi:MAG: polysaccharide biosynthesis tyrosine autokinase [Oscillospiraceae bacterium]|nr:polysaccharide biosynthesis tyrosine autokinase [Oscillospiraceae bacterium]